MGVVLWVVGAVVVNAGARVGRRGPGRGHEQPQRDLRERARVTTTTLEVGDVLQVGPAHFRLEQRTGSGDDSSMRRKEADAKKFDSTVSSAGDDLGTLVKESLKKAQGDYEVAGKAIGVEPDVLRYLATKLEIED